MEIKRKSEVVKAERYFLRPGDFLTIRLLDYSIFYEAEILRIEGGKVGLEVREIKEVE